MGVDAQEGHGLVAVPAQDGAGVVLARAELSERGRVMEALLQQGARRLHDGDADAGGELPLKRLRQQLS